MKKQSRFLALMNALLDLSDKSNKGIASAMGYEKPNLISMFRSGTLKVPLAKIPALAKALHTDPAHMLKLALEDYAPEVAEALDEHAGLATKAERKVMAQFRQANKGKNPDPPDTFFVAHAAFLRDHLSQ